MRNVVMPTLVGGLLFLALMAPLAVAAEPALSLIPEAKCFEVVGERGQSSCLRWLKRYNETKKAAGYYGSVKNKEEEEWWKGQALFWLGELAFDHPNIFGSELRAHKSPAK